MQQQQQRAAPVRQAGQRMFPVPVVQTMGNNTWVTTPDTRYTHASASAYAPTPRRMVYDLDAGVRCYGELRGAERDAMTLASTRINGRVGHMPRGVSVGCSPYDYALRRDSLYTSGITLCFIAPGEGAASVVADTRSWIVRKIQLAQWLSWGSDHWQYIHCEMFFHRSNKICSVLPETGVVVIDGDIKDYSRQGWRFFNIPAPADAEQRCLEFCQDHAARGTPFNRWGGSLLGAFWPASGHGRSFFCSELTAEALAYANLLDTDRPAYMIPVAALMDACVEAARHGDLIQSGHLRTRERAGTRTEEV